MKHPAVVFILLLVDTLRFTIVPIAGKKPDQAQFQVAVSKSGKYPTTKETWPKVDASSKFPAVMSSSRREQEVRFS